MAILDSSVNDVTDDGQYSLTMEIFDPSPMEAKGSSSGGGGGAKSNVIIVNTVSETPPQAVLGETENMDRRIYTAHVHARFMTEKLAKGNVSLLMDFFLRNPESRQDPYLVVIKGENANLLYSCSTGLSDTVGSYLAAMAESQMKATSEGVFVKTLEYLKDDYLDGKNPVMGCAEIIEDPTLQQSPEKGGDSSEVKQYVIRYKGLAAFRDGALQGYLDGIETRSFNILTGKFKSAVIELPSGDTQKEPGNVTLFQIINAKPDIKVKYEDDKVTVEANVKMKVGILQEAGKKDILNDDVKKQLSEDVRSIMESQLSAAVKKAQDLGCDVFGFGVAMHAQKPDEWRKIKDNWTEYFRNAEFQPKVEAVIVKTGESKAPFQLED